MPHAPRSAAVAPSAFRPAWWLRNPHLQTLWPYLFRRWRRIDLRRERLELPDGDFLDLDWITGADSGPIVLVLHGLEGSSRSGYAGGMLRAIQARGWRALVMHFRGCSGEPNRLPRSYHSGETGDLAYMVGVMRLRFPGVSLAVVGYSLGGNVLLKWLGETGAGNPLAAAVAVSVPFELHKAAWRLERGLSRLYQWKLLRSLRHRTAAKFSCMSCPVPLGDLSLLTSFRAFDDRVTGPLHGFQGADDYYARSSSRQYLPGIRIPTLIVHALDDPFMTSDAVPKLSELATATCLELSQHGGHVGFLSGRFPWKAEYWLERRIPEFLAGHVRAGSVLP